MCYWPPSAAPIRLPLIAQSVQKSRNARFNWVFIVLGIDSFTYSKNLWPTKHGILLSDDKSSFTQSSAYSYLLLYWQWDSIRKMKMQLWGLWLIFQSQMFLWKKTGDLKIIPYLDLDFVCSQLLEFIWFLWLAMERNSKPCTTVSTTTYILTIFFLQWNYTNKVHKYFLGVYHSIFLIRASSSF